jgi:cytochrome c biogenesis protein CcmG, thiol:disulfide interchange protein DsbE
VTTTATPPAPAPAPRRRRSHAVLFAAAGVGVVVIALIVLLATSQKPGDSADSPLVGHPAPALTGTTLAGKPFALSSLQGKFVLVNFFGSWCVPCQEEAPELRKWALEHNAKGDATLVNVAFNDTPDKVKAFFAAHGGASWPVVSGNTDALALDWGVSKAPESFLVTPNGTVVWKTIAPVTQAQLDALLATGTDAATTTTTAK